MKRWWPVIKNWMTDINTKKARKKSLIDIIDKGDAVLAAFGKRQYFARGGSLYTYAYYDDKDIKITGTYISTKIYLPPESINTMISVKQLNVLYKDKEVFYSESGGPFNVSVPVNSQDKEWRAKLDSLYKSAIEKIPSLK
jgi:hypothetical protein